MRKRLSLPAFWHITCLLMLLFFSGSASAQTLTLTASATQICAGGVAVLTATGASGAFAWAPNQDLSSTTGNSVVVAPLQTTTSKAQAVTITVAQGCCQCSTENPPKPSGC